MQSRVTNRLRHWARANARVRARACVCARPLLGLPNRLTCLRASLLALPLVLAVYLPAAGSSLRLGRTIIANAVAAPVASGSARFVGRIAPDHRISFAIALQPPHVAQENAFLQSLQDRNSPNFHRYLTPAQWNTRFAPTRSAQERVVGWLRSRGLDVLRQYPNRLILDVAGTAQTVDSAFAVRLGLYEIPGLRGPFYSNDRSPTVPASLAPIVQNVILNDYAPIHGLSAGSRRGRGGLSGTSAPSGADSAKSGRANGDRRVLSRISNTEPAGAAGGGRTSQGSRRRAAGSARRQFTGGYLDPFNLWSSYAYSVRALYNQGHCCNPFHNPTTGTPPDTSIAIATACPFLQSDLAGFSTQYGLAFHWKERDVDGGPSANDNCQNSNDGGRFETSLDVEYATAMSNSFGCYCDTSTLDVFEAPATGISSGGAPLLAFQSFFDTWEAVISADADRIMSTSWGGAESNWGPADEQTGHNILSNLAGMGITVVASTGDDGAYELGPSGPVIDLYPSADPEVVAAGGTQLQLNADGSYGSEVAWNKGGGGCSIYFAAPGWQTTGGFDNGCSGMRSQPDISLNASNITLQALYFDGTWSNVYGTSEVAPELAGIFAQFNAYALADGSICGSSGTSPCEPIGLPTPIIWHQGIEGPGYSPHYPFYDITSGDNDDGTGTGTYPTNVGYDLATGWGSINALQLYRLFAWYDTPDYHGPVISFSGPALGQWYNYSAQVSWTVSDPIQGSDPSASGVGGFSYAWDLPPGDPTSEPTPGCCNPYWNGPTSPNGTSGDLRLASAGTQGCHTPYVVAWDNLGRSDQASYGPLCYDTIPPSIVKHSFSPPSPSAASTVRIKATGTDPGCPTTGSCMSHIAYWVNTASDGTINGRWVQIDTSSGASGTGTWKTNAVYPAFFGAVSWDAGTHYVATVPWDRANNARSCSPPSDTNACLRYVLARPDWPQYRGNAQHTGFNRFEERLNAGSVGRLRRRCAFHNGKFSAPASVYAGIAYIGSKDGKVYAVNSSCKKKWVFPTGSPVVSSPDVTDGVVYVGSTNGTLYALNLGSGTMRWMRATGGAIRSSPVVSNGIVYVGSDDHYLYALTTLSGSIAWKYRTGGAIRSSPAIGAGLVFVGSDDGKVYAITTSGTRKWTFTTGKPVRSSPAVDGGRVFIGSENGRVYALKETRGTKVWSFVTRGKVDSSPAVHGGQVFVGSSDGNLYALREQNGQRVWAFSAGAPISGDPALADSMVAGGSNRGFFMLGAFHGLKLFSSRTGSSQVTLGNGQAYVVTKNLLEYGL